MFFQNVLSDLFPSLTKEEKTKFFLHDNDDSMTFNQIIPLSKAVNLEEKTVLNLLEEKCQHLDFLIVKKQGNKLVLQYTDAYITEKINILKDAPDLIIPEENKGRVIIDYSSPNICKEMHVGHLRSTIIGEVLSRVLEYVGYEVLRINHIGDWGTQFGMLIALLKENFSEHLNTLDMLDIKDITQLYKHAKKKFDESENFKTQSRQETFKLQQGDKFNTQIWQKMCQLSLVEFNKIYKLLGTSAQIIRGESFYQAHMTQLIQDLNNHLVDHAGMKVLFTQINNSDSKEQKHLILVKSDGGFTYDTSDLAALYYRVTIDKADKIIYVVYLGQEEHFKTLFKVYEDLNKTKKIELNYVGFGVILGSDGKRLKTRSGETIKLADLLSEAFQSALQSTQELYKQKENVNDIVEISEKIAVNCIKYADLSNPRTNSYKYNVEKMLNKKGDTAVYLMYAMARCKSILRKAAEYNISNYNHKIIVENMESRILIQHLLKFKDCIDKTLETLMPHYLCNYLYALVLKLTKFYEKHHCILTATQQVILHRISLIHLSLRVMSTLFKLLSLEEIEKI